MHSDDELKAIEIIDEALRGLNGEERLVVLVRLIERFSLEEGIRELFTDVSLKTLQVEEPSSPSPLSSSLPSQDEPVTIASFNSPSDIAAFAAPRTIKDRALVVAAFLQVKNEKEELTAYEINKALADGGHRSTNITAALGALMNIEVPLIVELPHVKDVGGNPRKRYLVTKEGIKRVEAMLIEFEEG